ncbi:bifunctional phosphopantothenoylcysteine decarboxylase/phosphopantothenate--cysteine ligase CoaBC [Alteribacter natronophilus]|uniref:bifunctional phosphopantothenoylcysteine decarboxylase/phosphopantothenate--cysteine ligase CoaBC n=1 Tax=Alteribacter natronophilus TaxID=2583810 RepID=UPI00110D62D8|nr:bifunctional phosphopantothenoylcysteine decarboxylase/phosphopantothenate--cysteine ligase CoaBC [Alteribacter natronophilus]TMW73165.1 bifunctional phosphopantothenoylcysteine decarboxylase/phosphopantothenate--cysteine ligase CoaBC [Alteribacter natronophilus]
MSSKKRVLLCVTGGIAMFKAAALTSRLSQNGFEVKVMMTDSAGEFVTPLTFQALSRNPVYTSTFDEKDPSKIAHIDVADWADLIIVAPATANVIGKLANGIADDMVTTTLLASTAHVMVAPAMNVHMYAHPAVQKNMETLKEFGYTFIEPGEGFLACGYEGKGRMEEPETIMAEAEAFFSRRSHPEWHGVRLLVTAGPTRETIDPVRYFSNRSSGKMGYAIAAEAAKRGAAVTLISGPSALDDPPGAEVIRVDSAEEMYAAVMARYSGADIVIKSAAVADYRPAETFSQKVKKTDGALTIEMERTKDILRTLGDEKENQVLVGFAAESENVIGYARGKLEKKNLDMIVANSITEEGSGFQSDTNKVTLIQKGEEEIELPLLSKADAAQEILNKAISIFGNRRKQ